MRFIQTAFALAVCSGPAALFAQASAGAEDIRDIREPIFDPAPWWELVLPYALGALGALVLALAGRALWRWLHRPRNPMQRALARIDAARRLASEGQVARFADELSEALRSYVEERFEVHAPRQTTEELLGRLATDEGSVLRAHREELATFLRICDEAKFGGYEIAGQAMDALAAAARDFVAQTYEAARENPSAAGPTEAGGAPLSTPTAAGAARANTGHVSDVGRAEEAA